MVKNTVPVIKWAPRVSREKILQLYVKVASGINDEALIEEIAGSFYRRCTDIIRVYEKRFACPRCHRELPHPHTLPDDLYCSNCGWRMPWQNFSRTYRGKQISVNPDITTITRRYLTDLPGCASPGEKVILIDSLIHACHEWVNRGISYYGRPLAVNLIEGTMNQVVAFLENLPYGPESLPEMNEQFVTWRKRCLSLFSDLDVERDKINYLIDSMPNGLKIEIEEMLAQKHRQKAVKRLAQIDVYAEELTVLRGNIASQMVNKIEKQMKVRE